MKYKTNRLGLVLSEDGRVLLEKLAKIYDRSLGNTIEFLVREEAKQYGLIESREKDLTFVKENKEI
jgi:hypothetical protein